MMDAVTRRARMRGFDTLWLPGMDHASIAVQNLVERHLAETEGKSRFDYTREEFIARAWDWKQPYGGQILGQMRRLGDGVDWSRERFTLDEGLSRAVQTIFKRLYDDGLIYRAERIINWCPRDLTALSDAEVDHADEPGELVSIRYGDGDDSIVVATTRAETMLGDTAVAVHPDDERYASLVGTDGRPAADRPAHPDHRRPARRPVVRHRRGQGDAGARPQRLPDRPASRPAEHHRPRRAGRRSPPRDRSRVSTGSRRAAPSSPRCARRAGSSPSAGRTCTPSGTARAATPIVEPRLSLQWWVKVETLAQAAGDAVRDGRVVVEPATPGAALLRLGRRPARLVHQPPAVVGPPHPGLVLARRQRAGVPRSGREPPQGWTQDPDVLDTWFSSGAVALLARWAGRTRPPTCAATTRPRCSSPATTSCSSGSCG